MNNNKEFINLLGIFEEKRKEIKREFKDYPSREEYAKDIAACFMPCAKAILAGHFRMVNNTEGKEHVREIYPTAIELYYHEEGDNRFKDPIMYHTNDRKNYDYYIEKNGQLKESKSKTPIYFDRRGIDSLPYFPIGSLNPHSSGIDVTFENSKERYRASFLIREYDICFYDGSAPCELTPVHVKNSTDIYEDMLVNGIPLFEADWIEWVDGELLSDDEVKQRWRRNVPDYVKVQCEGYPELWKKNTEIGDGLYFSGAGSIKYKKCPLNWQFAKK